MTVPTANTETPPVLDRRRHPRASARHRRARGGLRQDGRAGALPGRPDHPPRRPAVPRRPDDTGLTLLSMTAEQESLTAPEAVRAALARAGRQLYHFAYVVMERTPQWPSRR